MSSVTVTVLDLGRRIVEALGVEPGQSIELSKTRGGQVLLSRVDEAEAVGARC